MALRRSVHRRFVKGLPPGAGRMFTGQTDEESFLFWSVVSCTHRRFLFLLSPVCVRMISAKVAKPTLTFHRNMEYQLVKSL